MFPFSIHGKHFKKSPLLFKISYESLKVQHTAWDTDNFPGMCKTLGPSLA